MAQKSTMSANILTKKERKFTATVWDYYKKYGRRGLPWRNTKNPYRILVSEVMLQQTQVERVIPKYNAFLREFPTVQRLANASLGDVLRAWQGLGYNRRAKMLHICAKEVQVSYRGMVPGVFSKLTGLPGIGPYTAGAIMAFAYNEPVPIVETNIRTVYFHHFFKNKTKVADTEILQVITTTLDTHNPREWYWALMDYGSYLKKEHGTQNSKSKTYKKQSVFEGSDRQIRGAILQALSEKQQTRKQFYNLLKKFETARIDTQLEKFLKEEMIEKSLQYYKLPDK